MYFNITNLTLSILWAGFGFILLSFIGLLMGSGCGGRDVCGKRFCLTGILQDYGVLGIIIGLLITAAGIISLVNDLFLTV